MATVNVESQSPPLARRAGSVSVLVASLILVCALIVWWTGSGAPTAVVAPMPPSTSVEADDLRNRIDLQVSACQPTEQERLWATAGWTTSIEDAFQTARRLNRPVFMLHLRGRLDTGQC